MLLSAGVKKTTVGTRKLLQYLLDSGTPVYKETLFSLVYAFSNRLDACGCRDALRAMDHLDIPPSGMSKVMFELAAPTDLYICRTRDERAAECLY
jgi:hypothetical protein